MATDHRVAERTEEPTQVAFAWRLRRHVRHQVTDLTKDDHPGRVRIG
jgi:hypothetical protein